MYSPGQRVRAKTDAPKLLPGLRGLAGTIIRIVGEVPPYAYTFRSDDGQEFVLLGDELEAI